LIVAHVLRVRAAEAGGAHLNSAEIAARLRERAPGQSEDLFARPREPAPALELERSRRRARHVALNRARLPATATTAPAAAPAARRQRDREHHPRAESRPLPPVLVHPTPPSGKSPRPFRTTAPRLRLLLPDPPLRVGCAPCRRHEPRKRSLPTSRERDGRVAVHRK